MRYDDYVVAFQIWDKALNNSVPVVGTVEAYNVWTVALVKDSEFCNYLFLYGGLHLQMDHLLGHDGARRDVANAMHHACK